MSRAFSGPARDERTRELQRHRLGLVNGAHDPALSASLAGILPAHGFMSTEQPAAAQRYRMRRSALYGVPLADREPGHQEGHPDRIADTARRFEQLERRLTVEQKLALTDLSLDLRRPWMLRKLCQRPLTVEDEGERQALLSGLDVLAGPGEE